MSFSRELTMPIYVEKGTLQYGPLQALVNRVVEHKGVMENPWIYAIITYCKQSDLSPSRIK